MLLFMAFQESDTTERLNGTEVNEDNNLFQNSHAHTATLMAPSLAASHC